MKTFQTFLEIFPQSYLVWNFRARGKTLHAMACCMAVQVLYRPEQHRRRAARAPGQRDGLPADDGAVGPYVRRGNAAREKLPCAVRDGSPVPQVQLSTSDRFQSHPSILQ